MSEQRFVDRYKACWLSFGPQAQISHRCRSGIIEKIQHTQNIPKLWTRLCCVDIMMTSRHAYGGPLWGGSIHSRWSPHKGPSNMAFLLLTWINCWRQTIEITVIWEALTFMWRQLDIMFQYTPMSYLSHDDVIKWKHFPRYWPFVRGIHRSPVTSPHKGQRRGTLIFSLICVWINGWVNTREAGDLRRYRAHYDVTVMYLIWGCFSRTGEVICQRSNSERCQ